MISPGLELDFADGYCWHTQSYSIYPGCIQAEETVVMYERQAVLDKQWPRPLALP